MCWKIWAKKNRGFKRAPEQQRQEENGGWRHRQPPTVKTDKQRAAKFQIFFNPMNMASRDPLRSPFVLSDPSPYCTCPG
jgi:hypothetical protein